ncbi:MAG TPA: ABC transporter permease [Candidatus Limnocylindria bacterium]|jgi:ABC-2 type transport system permease protein|nr:ABC transporter permease [Candidatus Limnocylindria bacterium]
MRNVLLIAWREFAENAKTKGFWFGIFTFPAILMLSTQIPMVLEKKATPIRHFVLVDQSGKFDGAISKAVNENEAARMIHAFRDYLAANLAPGKPFPADRQWLNHTPEGLFDLGAALAAVRSVLVSNPPPFLAPRPKFVRAPLPDALASTLPLAELERCLRPYVSDQQRYAPSNGLPPVALFAAVLIPSDYDGGLKSSSRSNAVLRFWSVNQADGELRSRIESAVTSELRLREYQKKGLDAGVIRQIEDIDARVEQFNPLKAVGEEKAGLADTLRQWAPSAFVYLLWVAIFSIAQMLLNGLIEEKSNRIIEVLLSSVTPGELMIGKLVGVAAVGMVMLAAWIGSMVAVLGYFAFTSSHGPMAAGAVANPVSQIPRDLATLLSDTWLLPAFGMYFLLGYVLYASLIMALGSTCNTVKDAQNYMAVIVLFLMVPLLSIPFIPRDPNGSFATLMSWIPPYTPFIMMNRITAHPPAFDVVGTLLLLVLFDALVLWACGRIFRIGVLRTGQPPRFLQALAWIRR